MFWHILKDDSQWYENVLVRKDDQRHFEVLHGYQEQRALVEKYQINKVVVSKDSERL